MAETFTPPSTPAAEPRVISKSIPALRAAYERLAAQCTTAIAAGDAPLVGKLMADKKAAHAAWHAAVVAERHAKRGSTGK